MAQAKTSKNSRTSSSTQKFFCPSCGGELVMKRIFEKGRNRDIAECEKCKRTARRPSDFN